jgi:hypothetical protein
MATTYKNLGVQGTAGTGTYATLYNTGAATTAVISTIVVTNTASTAALYRIGYTAGSAGTPAIASGQWLVYDATIQPNDTVNLTIGATLGNSTYLRVSSSANTVCFNAFVSEIS